MERIKIAQIGIGHNHGDAKMYAVRKFPELFEVVGWCEEDESWIEKRGNLPCYQGIPRMTREEILNYPGLEAILVETDVWRMMEAAEQCVSRGLHIHLDKPAGEDFDEYDRILTIAEKNHAIIQLGYMYRYNYAVQYILERVRSGEMGRVLMVHAEMNTEHPKEFKEWLNHFQCGDMYIFGSHLIDLVLLLQGKPDAIHAFPKRSGYEGCTSVDSALAVLEYPYGTSTVRATSIEPNGYGRRQLVVVCEGGTFEVKPFENPTHLYFTPARTKNAYALVREEIPIPVQGPGERYDGMAKDLYAFIREGKENPFGYEYERMLHRCILQACGIL